jgi:hypothetical protein
VSAAAACAPPSPGPHLHELPVARPERHVGHALGDAGVEVKVVLSQESKGGGVTQEPAGAVGERVHRTPVHNTNAGCEERGWCLSADLLLASAAAVADSQQGLCASLLSHLRQ